LPFLCDIINYPKKLTKFHAEFFIFAPKVGFFLYGAGGLILNYFRSAKFRERNEQYYIMFVQNLKGGKMAIISMKQLLEAGVHFGHHTRKWNPKMAEYIFTERNGIYVIDLQKTVKKIEEAYNYVRQLSEDKGAILFIGTKKQAQESIKDEAARSGMFYVNQRWPGGMLTNFKTIKKSIARLNALYKMQEDGTFDMLPKKEVIALVKEISDLEHNYGGIKEMTTLPDALFIVDPRKERNAVMEAKKLGIPIVAIVDTNCDPDEIDYPIPGNDDAIRAIKLIASAVSDALIEGRQGESFAEAPATEMEAAVIEPDEKYSDLETIEDAEAAAAAV